MDDRPLCPKCGRLLIHESESLWRCPDDKCFAYAGDIRRMTPLQEDLQAMLGEIPPGIEIKIKF